MPLTKQSKPRLALLAGILTGFIFLISLFAGLGVPADDLLIIGAFFSVLAVCVTLLLRPAA